MKSHQKLLEELSFALIEIHKISAPLYEQLRRASTYNQLEILCDRIKKIETIISCQNYNHNLLETEELINERIIEKTTNFKIEYKSIGNWEVIQSPQSNPRHIATFNNGVDAEEYIYFLIGKYNL